MFKEKKKKFNKKIKPKNLLLKEEIEKYKFFFNQFKNFEKVFILLDSRIPNSCRIELFELYLKDKLVFILNKIDLIPREILISWFNYFSTISTTLAISSNYDINPIIEYLNKNNIQNSIITGLSNMGKKTLYNKLINNFNISITNNWIFLNPTHEQIILNTLPLNKSNLLITQTSQIFFNQCTNQSLSEVFNIIYSPDEAIKISSNSNKINQISCLESLLTILKGNYLFFLIPSQKFLNNSLNNFNKIKKKTFKISKLFDSFNNSFLILSDSGIENNLINPKIIQSLYKY